MNDNENNEPNENNQYMNKEEEEEQKIDGQLIYNEEQGYQDMEKLFNDDDQEYDTYEIEFKILDKNKNPQKVTIELQKIKYKKPYFGGFVNKTNVTYYYHAYTQNDQYKNYHIVKEDRDDQT